MSQWTHLTGMIRVDNLGACMVRLPTSAKNERIRQAIVKALGNTCNFDSTPEEFDQCTVPSGSEGSLQYKVIPNIVLDTEMHSLSWGQVVIWGDLRDFGSEKVHEVEEWFQKSLEKLPHPDGLGPKKEMSDLKKAECLLSTCIIRDAVLSINIECDSTIVLVWDGSKEQIRRQEFVKNE